MSIGRKTGIRSFTLVELLIVIAILAVLAAAVVVVLNPAELLAQARDSQRVTDMRTMKDAIDLWTVDNPSVTMGVSQTVYISIPDTSTTCSNITGLPTLPSGWVYHCVTTSNSRNIDGTGWIPLNFTTVKGGSPVPYLPLDPQNDPSLTKYYSYIPGGSYVLTALMESEKQGKTSLNDGGTDPGRLEVGTDLNLWKTASGLKGYWKLDEATSGAISTGTTMADNSASSFTGTATNTNGTGMSWAQGKMGGAVTFDGVDDIITIADGNVMNDYSAYTLMAFFKTTSSSSDQRIFSVKRGSGSTHISIRTTVGKSSGGWNSYSNYLNSNLSVNNGQWHHVALTFQGGNAALYVDGRLDSQLTGQSLNAPTGEDPPAIGALTTTAYFAGTIDEVMVFNRGLSASEVQAIYNAGK